MQQIHKKRAGLHEKVFKEEEEIHEIQSQNQLIRKKELSDDPVDRLPVPGQHYRCSGSWREASARTNPKPLSGLHTLLRYLYIQE